MAGHGKRSRSVRESFWRKMFVRYEASGLTQEAFCRRHSLSIWSFRWWRGRLKGKGASSGRNGPRPGTPRSLPPFLPVRVVESARRALGAFEVELRGGRTVRVPGEFDPEALSRLLAVLESPAC